jgi:hypothetical protein
MQMVRVLLCVYAIVHMCACVCMLCLDPFAGPPAHWLLCRDNSWALRWLRVRSAKQFTPANNVLVDVPNRCACAYL